MQNLQIQLHQNHLGACYKATFCTPFRPPKENPWGRGLGMPFKQASQEQAH